MNYAIYTDNDTQDLVVITGYKFDHNFADTHSYFSKRRDIIHVKYLTHISLATSSLLKVTSFDDFKSKFPEYFI